MSLHLYRNLLLIDKKTNLQFGISLGSDPAFDEEPLFWDDGTKFDDGKICLTAEFQLVLDPSKFAPRQKGIDEFAAFLESISTLLLPGDQADVNIREQYTLSVDNCVSHYQVRVRDYIDGMT